MAKVVVKLRSGKEINGDLLSFSPVKPVLHVQVEDAGGKTGTVPVSMGSIAAVFFLKKQEERSSVVQRETIGQSVLASGSGVRLHVEFKDGGIIHGSSHKYSVGDKGFYLVPLNPADKYERVYVNASAVKKVDCRRLMGKILVDHNKITLAQLEHSIQYQREVREKKIGTILLEHAFITHEQLEKSLQKQKEHPKYLGEILLEAGYITGEQLEYALLLQRRNRKKKLGQILVELKYLLPNDICIALATQLEMPWADLSSLEVAGDVATILPEELMRELEIVPVERRGNTLVVASAAPQEPGLIGLISRHSNLRIELVVAYEVYIESLINQFFPAEDRASQT